MLYLNISSVKYKVSNFLFLLILITKFSITALLIAGLGALGVTAGAHRLWAHRAYKAKWPMRVLLMIFQTLAFQVMIKQLIKITYKYCLNLIYYKDKDNQRETVIKKRTKIIQETLYNFYVTNIYIVLVAWNP